MNTKNDVTRMTVELPTDLHRKAKSFAALKGTTLRQLILIGLSQQLEESHNQKNNQKNVPNTETLKAMKESEQIMANIKAGKKSKKAKEFKNIQDLFHDLRN